MAKYRRVQLSGCRVQEEKTAPCTLHPAPFRPPFQLVRIRNILLPLLLLGLLIGCRENRAAIIFDRAEGFWEDGRYKEAIEEYEALVTVHPQSEFSPKAIYKIGIIRMLYLSDYDKALETFKRLSSLFPESMEARLSRRHAADIYMNNIEDYKRAVFEYQQLIDDGVIDDPDMAQFNIAVAYLKLGDLAQARIEFRDLIERYPASPLTAQAYYQVANSFLLEGEGEEAIKEYEKVIEVYPDSPFYIESQFGIAMLLEEMGKLKEALSLYNTIEKEYPNPFALRVRIEGLENRLKQ